MARTITITADGTVTTNPWPAGLLEHLYSEIACRSVEIVDLGDVTVWYDDEGPYASAPVTNELITKLLGTYGPLVSDIVGTVVLTGGADADGDTLPLDDNQAAELVRCLEQLRHEPMPVLHTHLFL